MDFIVPAAHRVKLKQSEKIEKYIDLAKELKKIMERVSDSDTNCNWCVLYSHQRFGTRTGGLGNKWTSGDHPNYSIVETTRIQKSSGDLRRLVVTQTPVKRLSAMTVNNSTNNNVEFFFFCFRFENRIL